MSKIPTRRVSRRYMDGVASTPLNPAVRPEEKKA
jgi:hypothetical protein